MPLKIYRRPNGWYHIRGTHHGRPVDQSARTRSAASAEQVREAIERQIFDEVIHRKAPERTFAVAAAGYMEGGGERDKLQPILVRIGNMSLKDITQSVIDETALAIYPRNKAGDATRLRKVYTPISAVLNWAADNKWVERPKIRRPAAPRGRVDWRTPAEIETWIAQAEHIAPLLTFIVATGMRASEAVHLDWQDVSLKGERVTLWDENTKGGYTRHIDLQARARAALPPRSVGPVWLNSRGKAWHSLDAVDLWLRRAAERKGLPHLHLHVLRHTWATWAYAVTRDLTFLMQQGGWKTADLALRYVHAGTDDLAEEVLRHGWEIRGRSNRGRAQTQARQRIED